jgi:hypothetical protein
MQTKLKSSATAAIAAFAFAIPLASFAQSDNPADNRRVLQPYSDDMKRLIKRGLKETVRPSGHVISGSFANDQGGSIPPNLIQCGNNESNSNYIKKSKLLGGKVHPARFPAELPRFFTEFLTDPSDVVMDPFAGSNTTGQVAESLGRRWISVELREDYAQQSLLRFSGDDARDVESGQTGLFVETASQSALPI